MGLKRVFERKKREDEVGGMEWTRNNEHSLKKAM